MFSEVLQRLQRELEEHCTMKFNGVFADVYIQPKDILPNVFEGKLVSEVCGSDGQSRDWEVNYTKPIHTTHEAPRT